MKEGFALKSREPGPEEMKKINCYTRRECKPEEIYIFSLVLCDNEIDRDNERFSVDALTKLRELFLGKTCILDHERKSVNQTARIFDTAIETEQGRLTKAGETYTRLTARAYLPRTKKNREVIEMIESGILKEVSVSCAVKRSVCSLCGKESCSHQKGREYGGKLCTRILEEPTDAYECSIVTVPNEDGRKEKKMENKSKPRICDILGVEIGQPFKAVTPHMGYDHLEVDQEGVVWYLGKSWPYKVAPRSLCYMINHPECIHKIPCWTPEEMELAKAIKVVWPNADTIIRVCGSSGEWIRILTKNGYAMYITVEASRFPTLKSNESAHLSDIIGGD